ncbi:Hypothetical predicted protein [Olea europaea subsp. europaea]|uniref:Uncharacterized protein n=1 Tax=Olea europaea subsp. europaea TaxID=158383 RepID=A0A8S0U2V4_OLEEU|nr:Hypothetical predicted protein [Olea europaea subsp. europaea]
MFGYVAEYMDFEFLVPENARLRAHISQRSNLRYVKIVLEHFDDRQHADFCNSCIGFLFKVPDLQFSAQLIQQLVFHCIRTDKAHELWFNLQGHLARITCAKLEKAFLRSSAPRADRYKLDLTLIIEGVFNAPDNHAGIDIPMLSIIDDQDIFFSYPWDAKQKMENVVTYRVRGFSIAMQVLYNNFIGYSHYFNNLCIVMAAFIVNSHLFLVVTDMSIRGNARNWWSVWSTAGSTIPTASQLEFNKTTAATEFISTLVPPSGSATTVPTAEAKNEPIDIGGCGMNFEPRMNDDDDEVASSGWGNREDEPVASTSGVAEVDDK